MSTREGCFPEITFEQLAVLHRAREMERLDFETVFLKCPALSEEAGRKLPIPVERSLLSETVLSYLKSEGKSRRWAEEKVRQNPESPALYLFARWWEGICDCHQAIRLVTIASWELADADAGDCSKQDAAFSAAAVLCYATMEERRARRHALYVELS